MPERSTASDVEWSLLLAACSAIPPREKIERIRMLLTKTGRWPRLLELADQHGVSSLVYKAASGLENEVPSEALHALKVRHQTNIQKSLILARELIRILDHLDSQAIEVIPHKGLTLAETMYGDMALRQSGDIDLLVRSKDASRARDALCELGYTPQTKFSPEQERAYLISGYECTFDGELGKNLLELQWAVQPRFYAVDIDIDDLFRRAATVAVAGRRAKTLSSEDLLLVLSLHAAKHVWARLLWLCDIAQIMNLQALRWDWIENQARELGVLRILRVTLLLANRLLDAQIPASLEDIMANDRDALALAHEIRAQIVSGVSYDVESVAYFRLMLRLRERRSDRVRFLQRLAFTPGPNEWQAIRLPAPLFPLYRLVRLSRLAARMARV
jgi:hypothetical protein